MKITKEMIDPKFFEELGIFQEELQVSGMSQYMEYPPSGCKRRFVMQHHWRGASVHKDFRMEMNNHLVGWTILDNPSGTPEVKTMLEAEAQIKKLDWAFDFNKKNKGLRAETKCYSEICNEWKYNLIKCEDGIVYLEPKTESLSISLEELARQPKEWLKVNGVVKPGEVGATKEETGVLDIVEHGVFWEGTQKPYFHEYFLKTDVGNFLPKGKWARVVFRGVQVPKIDPVTKKPIKGQMEYMWKCMIPGTQIAYALQRGIKKGWKPPKGVIPIPPDQRSGELWDKWQAYMEGKAKTTPEKDSLRELEGLPFAEFKNFKDCVNKIMDKKGFNEKRASAYCSAIARKTGEILDDFTCEECIHCMHCIKDLSIEEPACEDFEMKEPVNPLAGAKFNLQVNTYMGQVVVRAVPHVEFYFRLQTNGVDSWYLDGDPVRINEIGAMYEGKVNNKWMTWEGKIQPGEMYNPTKTLIATMRNFDSGSATVEVETDDQDRKIYHLKLHGKILKGNYDLIQEEKGADMYSWKVKEQSSLASGEFVLHRHYWDNKQHWDIRVKITENPKILIEWNLWKNPLEANVGDPIPGLLKTCNDPKNWFMIEGQKLPRKVGSLETFVDVLDHGKIDIIEQTGGFMSMKLYGDKIKGYWVLKRSPEGDWFFIRSKLPQAQTLSGDPLKGDYYDPFIQGQKKGWDYYWLHLYDMRVFTRCESDYKTYFPDLSIPDYVEDILVCLYPKPGTLHWARVSQVKFKGDTPIETATKWIKDNNLHTWTQEMKKKGKA
jgi:hypothetical protein